MTKLVVLMIDKMMVEGIHHCLLTTIESVECEHVPHSCCNIKMGQTNPKSYPT